MLKLTLWERAVFGGVLAVANFLQLEVAIAHWLHVAIVAVSVFITTIMVVDETGKVPPATSSVDNPVA